MPSCQALLTAWKVRIMAPFAQKTEIEDKSPCIKAVAIATMALVSLVADRRRHIGIVRHYGATGYDQGARARRR